MPLWPELATAPPILLHAADPAARAHTWWIGLTASAIISVAFLGVAVMLAISMTRTKQWSNNPLGVGTMMLYITCGGGHLVHTIQLSEGSLGLLTAVGTAARIEYGEWHMWGADVVTAMAGVWYWTMRRYFPGLVTGAAVFEDLRTRQRKALEIHDTVVQGLARAKLALELGEHEQGEEAVAETLQASKRIITDLLGTEGVRPGDLRREVPGVVHGGE